jgi:hypothetical protein
MPRKSPKEFRGRLKKEDGQHLFAPQPGNSEDFSSQQAVLHEHRGILFCQTFVRF